MLPLAPSRSLLLTVSKVEKTLPDVLRMLIRPVVEPPKESVWRAVVCKIPAADKYAPPAVPAEREAMGVADPLTFKMANLAEVVETPPTRTSRVVLPV